MKKLSKLVLILFMLVTAAFAVTACGSVEEIKIDRSNGPQTTYVVGTDFNREKGAIMASGEYDPIPLSDGAIEISGYDKNTIGKQTVTITYMGASTTITVEVVPRMEPKNFNYFVGEKFEAGKSQLKINNDDGSSKIIDSDDPDLKIEGFDSSKAATIQVQATYQSEDMKQNDIAPYVASVDVNIYDVANNGGKGELHRPSKNTYESHELELVTSGGYFVLESANKELTRTVQVTPDMISGFDLSVAKVENMDNPVTQHLTISYAAYTFNYDIQITFSNVSLVKLRAKELSDKISWKSGIPTVSEEDGKLAREMTDLFLSLSEARRAFVDSSEYLALARYTAIYERSVWENELKNYHFKIKDNTIVPTFDKFEDAKADYDKLIGADGKVNAENTLYKLSVELTPFLSTFYGFRFYNGQTIGSYMTGFCAPTEFDKLIYFFPIMQQLDEALKDVDSKESQKEGNEYDFEYLKANSEKITNASALIMSTKITAFTDREYFKAVSKWREKDDYYRIIYTYYLKSYEEATKDGGTPDSDLVSVMRNLPSFILPGILDDYWVAYLNAYAAYGQLNSIITTINANKKADPVDNTTFFYYYDKAYEILDEIEESDDKLCQDLYITFGLGSGLLQMKAPTYNNRGAQQTFGYVQLHDNYYKDARSDALWADYLDVVEKTLTDPDYGATDDFTEEVEALFKGYMDLTPSRQQRFLASLDVLYISYGQPKYLWDFSEIYAYFVKLIADHYGDVLSAKGFETLQSLMLASEDYISHYDAEEFMDGFKTNMETTKSLYSELSSEEKATFDSYVGKYYEKYLKLYEGASYGDYGQWQGKIDELKGLIDTTLMAGDTIMKLIQQSQQGQSQINPLALFPALASSFERASSIVEDIFTNAPDDIRDKFCFEEVDMNFEMPCSIDYAYGQARGAYMFPLTIEMDDYHTMLMDGYFGAGFDKLLIEGYTAIINQFYVLTEQTDRAEEFNKDSILKAIDIYFDLDIQTRINYLMTFDSADLFAGGVKTFFSTTASGMKSIEDAVEEVFNTETAYILWSMDHDGKHDDTGLTYQAAYSTALKELKDEYGKLSDSDKALFNEHFKDPYDFFVKEEDTVKNYKSEAKA